MRRWLRWIRIGLGAVVGLVVILLAAVYTLSYAHLSRRYRIAQSPVTATSDSASLRWGEHRATAIGKCQECHGADLGGRLLVDNLQSGRLAAPNLTSGRGGTGDWSDADWERAIRHGVRRNGRPLLFMPAEAFAPMSDKDLAALVGYLRTVPPVDRELSSPRVGPVARTLFLFTAFPLVSAELIDHSARPPAPTRGPRKND